MTTTNYNFVRDYLLKLNEGFSTKIYFDTNGIPTVRTGVALLESNGKINSGNMNTIANLGSESKIYQGHKAGIGCAERREADRSRDPSIDAPRTSTHPIVLNTQSSAGRKPIEWRQYKNSLLIIWFAFASVAQADPIRDDIYRQALAKIASIRVEPPYNLTRLAVVDTLLSTEDMARMKVPRHHPKLQFTQNIPGVSAELELSLMYSNFHEVLGMRIEKGREAKLDNPDALNDSKPLHLESGVNYLGILNKEALIGKLKDSDQEKKPGDLWIVKFSEVGFYRNKALVYAEVVSPSNVPPTIGDAYATGYGFLFDFDRGKRQARLITMKALWTGAASYTFWPQLSAK